MLKTISATTIALIFFAANTVLCRYALKYNAIDAASFTFIRIFSGVALLMIILLLSSKKKKTYEKKGSWLAGFMLFVYASCFSFSYLMLDTGTGALILFGFVHLSMLAVYIRKGNKLHITDWLGIIIAFSGLVYLVLPNIAIPNAPGFILMAVAGVAWGFYTLLGQNSENPIEDTAYNFFKAAPFAIVLSLIFLLKAHISMQGFILAASSGAIASGLGYAIWYLAIKDFAVTFAAVIQLTVPVIAAISGIILLNENITLSLVVSSITVPGGIMIMLLGRQNFKKKA